MALPQPAFDLLRSLAPCRLLSLGYPDLLISDEFDVPEVANADKQRLNHSWQGKIYETDAVFRRIGIEATYADISAHTGLEKPIDLNSKIAKAPQYDVVLDPGTLEHCFNIGQAFVNVRNMTRIGGHILHLNPLNIVNHGFYNVSPTTYYDFYELHGDQIRIGAVIDKEGGTGETYRKADAAGLRRTQSHADSAIRCRYRGARMAYAVEISKKTRAACKPRRSCVVSAATCHIALVNPAQALRALQRASVDRP